jgi:hypothetical protein
LNVKKFEVDFDPVHKYTLLLALKLCVSIIILDEENAPVLVALKTPLDGLDHWISAGLVLLPSPIVFSN